MLHRFRRALRAQARWVLARGRGQHVVLSWSVLVWSVLGQVTEGDSEVVNIRETNDRLGPLVFTLVALGIASILGTVAFWWVTRPNRLKE